MDRTIKFEEFVKITESRMEELLSDIRGADPAKLTALPFQVCAELLAADTVKKVRTPMGTFTKYRREAYEMYSPMKGGKFTVEEKNKVKFIPKSKPV